MEQNKDILNLFTNTTAMGRFYQLKMRTPDGHIVSMPELGASHKPFQLVATFPAQPFVAVKRTLNTPQGEMNLLYLVDTNTCTVSDKTPFGTDMIVYDALRAQFYCFDRGQYDAATLAQIMATHQNTAAVATNSAFVSPMFQNIYSDAVGIDIPTTDAEKLAYKLQMSYALGNANNSPRPAVAAPTPRKHKKSKIARRRKHRLTTKMRPKPRRSKKLHYQIQMPYALRQKPKIKYMAPKLRTLHHPNIRGKLRPQHLMTPQQILMRNLYALRHQQTM